MTILALDLGKKRIGLAISHGIMAEGIGIIDFKNYFVELEKVIEKEKVDKIVIGLPLSASGEKTGQSAWSLDEGEKIAKKFGLPVSYVDEAYSSVVIESKKRYFDDESAKVILEQYLNEEKSLSRR